jgi:hypothetical protein
MYFVVIEDDSLYDRFIARPIRVVLIDYRDTSCSEGANSARSSTVSLQGQDLRESGGRDPIGEKQEVVES